MILKCLRKLTGEIPLPFNLQGFFSFRFLTNWNSVGLKFLIHRYIDTDMYLYMHVHNFLKASISLWYDVMWWDPYQKSLEESSCLSYMLTSSSGHQEHTGCMYVELSGHQGSPFWCWHLQRVPETRMPRLEYWKITNQTRQACFLNLLLIRTTISIGHESQEFIWKHESWKSFLSTNLEPSPAEISSLFLFVFCLGGGFCFCFWSFDEGDMEYEQETETQGKVKEYPQVGQMTKVMESHILSQLQAAAPAKGDPQGGRERWEERRWGAQVQDSGILPKPCLVFSLRDQHTHPTLTTPLHHLSASCGCKLVITTLRKHDLPSAMGVGLALWGVPLVDLLTEEDPEHPDGAGKLL